MTFGVSDARRRVLEAMRTGKWDTVAAELTAYAAAVRAAVFATGAAALRTVADTARQRGQVVVAHLLEAAGARLPLTTAYPFAPPLAPQAEELPVDERR